MSDRVTAPARPRVVPRSLSPAVAAAVGHLALGVALAAGLRLALGAAAGTRFLASRSRGVETPWLLGPLAGLGSPLTRGEFALLVLVLLAAYLVVLACAAHVRAKPALATVVALHVLFGLAPAVLSPDLFGYMGFARLGALHGLDPYLHPAAAAPGDPVFPYVAWKGATSPYGPLFTMVTYVLAPLGVPALLWALKAAATVAALGCLALVWSCARRLGRDPLAATLLVGLNPLVLVWAVGGGHNDLWAMLGALGGVRLVLAGREGGGGAVLTAAAAVKASTGLLLPFVLLAASDRRRALLGATAAAVLTTTASIAAFGPDGVLGYLATLLDQGRLVTIYSVPHRLELAAGADHVSQRVQVAGFLVFLGTGAAALRYAARGGDPIAAAGWTTLAFLLTTTWLLPWYVTWLLPLAALTRGPRLRLATHALVAFIVTTRLPLLPA